MSKQKINLRTFLPPDQEGGKTLPSQDYGNEILRVLKLIDYNIEYQLKSSNTNILTNEQKHNILQALFTGKDGELKKLTDKEKIRILERLFIGDAENLKNLSDDEKLGIFDKLLKGEKKHEAENILSEIEKSKILHDLFLGEEGELDSSFLYNGKGAELYEKISKDKSYPFIDVENNILKYLNLNQKFRKVMEKTKCITDVGAGDGEKALSLLGDYRWRGTYIPEDYSPEMLQIAARNIKKWAPGLNLGSLNILTNGKHLASNIDNNMYLFLGGTICNMSNDEIIKELRNMDNNGILSGNHILLSYFTAPNTQEEINELIRIYNSDANRRFHENGMKMLGLSQNDFEFDTVYEKDDPTQKYGPFPGRIKGIIRAKKDCTVKLDGKKNIDITKGQEFTLHFSRRFTKKGIKKLFDESSCKVVFTEEGKGDSIVLLKRAPTKRKTLTDKIKNVLIGVLVGTSIFVGGNYYNTYQKNKETQDKLINRSFKKDIGKGIDYTLESQASKELLTAIGLDKADSETKKAINLNFNTYIKDHEKDSLSTEDYISSYRNIFGGTLIKHFGAHPPYSFITKELIDNTNYAAHEGKAYKESNEFNTKNYESSKRECDFFEYDDNGEKYHMLKAYIGKKPVYLASKENNGIITYSTNNVENIRNKEGLNKAILANNHKLETNIITRAKMRKNGDIDKLNILLLYEDCVDFRDSDTYTLYLNGKKYYLKIGKTLSGYGVLGASKSSAGPFSVEIFDKEISQDFKCSPYGHRTTDNYEQRREGAFYGSSHGMGGNPFASDKLEKPE